MSIRRQPKIILKAAFIAMATQLIKNINLFRKNSPQKTWKSLLIAFIVLILVTEISAIFSIQAGEKTQTQNSTSMSGGVGLYLGESSDGSERILVYTVTYKSPADKAKVKKGDELLAVDGNSVQKKSLEEIAKRIAGPPGSTVTLTLLQKGQHREVTLTRQVLTQRAPITLPSPEQTNSEALLSPTEKKLVKEKILGLKTEEERERMFQLLSALKSKKMSKQEFMQQLKQEFP